MLDLAPHGNLHTLVSDEFDTSGKPLSDIVILVILDQIIDGMEELQINGIIHKDLALRNILVHSYDRNFPERIRVKISDFGVSSIMDSSASSFYYTGSGGLELPIRWMAPESLTRNKWSEKTDVYSLGVLIWELVSSGQVPWGLGRSNGEIQDKIVSGETLSCAKETMREISDLIARCCSLSPHDRPTFRDIKGIIASIRTSMLISPNSEQHISQSALVRII